MSIIAIAILVLVCVILLCWGVDQVQQFSPHQGILKLLIIVGAVLFLLNKAGVV